LASHSAGERNAGSDFIAEQREREPPPARREERPTSWSPKERRGDFVSKRTLLRKKGGGGKTFLLSPGEEKESASAICKKGSPKSLRTLARMGEESLKWLSSGRSEKKILAWCFKDEKKQQLIILKERRGQEGNNSMLSPRIKSLPYDRHQRASKGNERGLVLPPSKKTASKGLSNSNPRSKNNLRPSSKEKVAF